MSSTVEDVEVKQMCERAKLDRMAREAALVMPVAGDRRAAGLARA
jgi:hypothetical protein